MVTGAAGEVGHITIDPNGFECTCGKRGCLETVSSATGVVRVARHLAEEYAGDSRLKAMLDNGEEVTSKRCFELSRSRWGSIWFDGGRSCLSISGTSLWEFREHVESIKHRYRWWRISCGRILRSRSGRNTSKNLPSHRGVELNKNQIS